jgi:hypothetical protein
VGRAIELADELEALADSGRARNPDALGFMLRAFFDGLRRHLDWMDVTIMPAARDGLDAPGLPHDALPVESDTLLCNLVWRNLVGPRVG